MASLSSRCSSAVVGETERRSVVKTRLCKFYAQGSCRRGGNCSYAHGYDELQHGSWRGNRRRSSHRDQSDVVPVRTSDGRFGTSDETQERTPFPDDNSRAGSPEPPWDRPPPQHLQHTSGFALADLRHAQHDALASAATPQQFQHVQGIDLRSMTRMIPLPLPVMQAAMAQPTNFPWMCFSYPQGGQAFAPRPLGVPVGSMGPQHPSGFPYQPPNHIPGRTVRPPQGLVQPPLRREMDNDDDNSVNDDARNTSLRLPPVPRMRSAHSQVGHSSGDRDMHARVAEIMGIADGRNTNPTEFMRMQEAIMRSFDNGYSGGYGSQPLNEAEIDNLTTGLVFSHASCKDTECPICLDEFDDGQDLRGLKCGHAYHEGCIGSWLSRSSQCPKCKQSIRI